MAPVSHPDDNQDPPGWWQIVEQQPSTDGADTNVGQVNHVDHDANAQVDETYAHGGLGEQQ
ncbi:hypothetical protein HDU87_003406 [Geranomyces variabilis]|uniref:Uncharacterized protein n=1 Tax=Geranomyces variabilis TaxID=109894 RepID=A0AAD5TKR3_9FUNG|nr:hypothetical protein HDU87_003406 [Geranomyces variabilis]